MAYRVVSAGHSVLKKGRAWANPWRAYNLLSDAERAQFAIP